MRWWKKIGLISLLGIVISNLSADATPTQLSVAEINSISKQTTVMIAPQITKEDLNQLLENQQPKTGRTTWGVGSGVIVGKQGNTYYVLTVAHNFNNSRLNQNHPYGIVTGDRQVHLLTNLNDRRGEPDCPQTYRELMSKTTTSPVLFRFGCFTNDNVYGIDLAIVTFQSDNKYPVASLGNAEQLNQGDLIYISGWPKLEQEPKLNPDGSVVLDAQGNVVCNGLAPRRQRRLAWGPLKEKLPFSEAEDGYSLAYLDYTRQGMSGGPVFDSSGRVIGIHGRGSDSKPKCGQPYTGESSNTTDSISKNNVESEDEWEEDEAFESEDEWEEDEAFESEDEWEEDEAFESENEWEEDEAFESENEWEEDEAFESEEQSSTTNSNAESGVIKQFSSAQSIDNSLNLIQKERLILPFNVNPPSREFIQAGLIPIDSRQIEGGTNSGGRADFDAKQGAFNDSNDTVEDIYKLFSFKLENMLREKPSGGCGSLLLGDRCEEKK